MSPALLALKFTSRPDDSPGSLGYGIGADRLTQWHGETTASAIGIEWEQGSDSVLMSLDPEHLDGDDVCLDALKGAPLHRFLRRSITPPPTRRDAVVDRGSTLSGQPLLLSSIV
ncbi:hypothetical protein B0H67DRAFT_14972 [Lasiosphaeris hirsuta]|uniref:Uncharacterized protein n=1 Tax=Lasiosphaeris hirsuta TaxID=260670 RepID=A0AA40B910_9PEZI|nr:hypothetical protein B0H67DRAFT_14972 [Lasiosphaeris hirsuta]